MTAPAGPMTFFQGSLAKPTLATWAFQAWVRAARVLRLPAYQAFAHISRGSAVALKVGSRVSGVWSIKSRVAEAPLALVEVHALIMVLSFWRCHSDM
eukprot:9428642-Heterocapsa_arctica.AAC.1